MLFHRVGPQQRSTGLDEVWSLKKSIALFEARTQHSQSRFPPGRPSLRPFSESSILTTVYFTHLSTRSAYNLLLERVPAPPEAERKRLLPDDHKAIDYWYRHQWTSASASNRITEISSKAENENGDEDVEAEGEELESVSPAPGSQRGQGRCRAGINVSMRYIQDTDGKVIDGHRAREIRIHARAIFVGFAMQGKHFASWGDADATSRRFFYNEMVIRFEELQYCDLDWKAEQIATDTFPGWKTTWVKKQKKASLEPPNGMKRSRQGSIVENTDLKRTKSMEIDEATSLVPVPQVSATSLDTSQVCNSFHTSSRT